MKPFASLGLVTALLLVTAPQAGAIDDGSTPVGSADSVSLATFEGQVIDLRKGWGKATACHSDGRSTECFATAAEMEATIAPGRSTLRSGGSTFVRLVCASTLRLYSGISYTGSVLALSTQGAVINLSTYGFSNATTSYKVGACSSIFYDGASGSGSVYPGYTGAGAQYPNMVTGWNDRISSVFIS